MTPHLRPVLMHSDSRCFKTENLVFNLKCIGVRLLKELVNILGNELIYFLFVGKYPPTLEAAAVFWLSLA